MNPKQQAKKINPLYISPKEDDWDDWSDGDNDNDDNNEQLALSLVEQEYGRPLTVPSPHPTNQTSSTLPNSPLRYLSVPFIALVFLILLSRNSNKNDNEEVSTRASSLQTNNAVQHIAVIGERHSGIPWMQTTLQECFPQASVSTSLQRIGYFFQDQPVQHPTIVIHMILNVYDWLEQMRTNPEYMPMHLLDRDRSTGRVTPLPWREFLSTPWTLNERPARDLPYKEHSGNTCQMEFEYHRVMSCIEDDTDDFSSMIDNPIYELREDGTAFSSILELRAAKIRNHHAVAEWTTVPKFITVPYEKLGDKFDKLLTKIEETTGWKRTCSSTILPPILSLAGDGHITLELVDYLNDHVDWQAEALTGYTPWTDVEISKYHITHEASNGSNEPSKSETKVPLAETSDPADVNGDEGVLTKDEEEIEEDLVSVEDSGDDGDDDDDDDDDGDDDGDDDNSVDHEEEHNNDENMHKNTVDNDAPGMVHGQNVSDGELFVEDHVESTFSPDIETTTSPEDFDNIDDSKRADNKPETESVEQTNGQNKDSVESGKKTPNGDDVGDHNNNDTVDIHDGVEISTEDSHNDTESLDVDKMSQVTIDDTISTEGNIINDDAEMDQDTKDSDVADNTTSIDKEEKSSTEQDQESTETEETKKEEDTENDDNKKENRDISLGTDESVQNYTKIKDTEEPKVATDNNEDNVDGEDTVDDGDDEDEDDEVVHETIENKDTTIEPKKSEPEEESTISLDDDKANQKGNITEENG